MDILDILLNCLILLGLLLLMAAPLVMGYLIYRRDKKAGISHKRLRVILLCLVYVIAATVALCFLQELLIWLESLTVVQWLVSQFGVVGRIVYSAKVLVAVIVNAAIGFLFLGIQSLGHIGLKKKNLTEPGKKDGTFTLRQKLERRVLRYFHTETWFFVARILKWFTGLLSAAYAVVFALYLLPVLFSAGWIPYAVISQIFGAGYLYPMLTLLVLWEACWYLEGNKNLEEECPALLEEEAAGHKEGKPDLDAIDREGRKCFRDYFAAAVERGEQQGAEVVSTEHHEITRYIAQAVEQDRRNPQKPREAYLNCLDQIARKEHSLLINGSFFSEFSMYFLRYLSVIIARGDHVMLVCSDDTQCETVYRYVQEGLSQISSLFCKGFEAVDYDDPIWRVVKVCGDCPKLDTAGVDDHSVLVTTMNYVCSAGFESEHGTFLHLLDTVVLVDTLNTVNASADQMTIFNTRMGHIAGNSAVMAKNGNINRRFLVRYMSRQIRYLCFDHTRTPGLDKVLKNMLQVQLETVDAMHYDPATMIRCYRYEGIADENGRRSSPHFVPGEEEVGVVMNMAMLCLAKGAGNVTVFADDGIPYANIAETIAANMGQIAIVADERKIRLNRCAYNPDDYSVIIAMDSQNDLPAAIRKYASMTSDKPALLLLFSRPYLFRDYYLDHISQLWNQAQMTRIPVGSGSRKDVAQKILVKANAGGISTEEVLNLCAGVPQFAELAKKKDINGLLRGILETYGVPQEERVELFRHFEYTSCKDFDENGAYIRQDRILLRRQGRLFDIISGQNMVQMVCGDRMVPLTIPADRLSQNFIAGQNLLLGGNIYYIQRVDVKKGRIYTRLAVGGKNDEAYEYLQNRHYHVECGPDQLEPVMPVKHVVLDRKQDQVAVREVVVSAFHAPTEVVTKGYYSLDPHLMAVDYQRPVYHSISQPGNDQLEKQTYRRYGAVKHPVWSDEAVMQEGELDARSRGALMMSLRMFGQFGENSDRVAALAAAMLNETLHSMFPSVADALVVCPVLRSGFADEESARVLPYQPSVTVTGREGERQAELELLILEDSTLELGVVSVLMSAGDDVLSTLFGPVLSYLNWYAETGRKSDYLYYGLDHEPACFDFASLRKLASLVGDDRHDLKFVDIGTLIEYETCDFCGRRHAKGGEVVQLDDGRRMCRTCAGNLVGNSRRILKAHLDRAKIFLESTYGITLEEDYEFCFASTVKIANMLKQKKGFAKRGQDIPLKSFLDDKKQFHLEASLPSVNLSELLVRELTYAWQLRNLTDVPEELAEGHIALVGLQYLRFLNQDTLANSRTNYYLTAGSIAGEGYRKLVRALLEAPQYRNNPFRYLLEGTGGEQQEEEQITPPAPPQKLDPSLLGKPYVPQKPDRVLQGKLPYFHYDRLTATVQRAYDTMLEAIENHRDKVTVPGCGQEEIFKAADAIHYDHPELFYFTTVGLLGSEVTLYYGASAEEVAVLNRRIEEVLPRYLEGIQDSMSAYDVALRLHTRVIQSVDYDTIALNRQKAAGGPKVDQIDYLRTICGVFLNGKAVCEGYARAMQYLLQKCGVECAEAVGYIRKESGEADGAHAWNILKIDGDYYYLDTTWDDRSNTIQTVKKTDFGYGYFCITTEELLRTRDLKLNPVDMPGCVATRANYYWHNGLVLASYDLDAIKQMAVAAAEGGRKAFTFKCASQTVYREAMDKLCADGSDCYDVLKQAAKKNKQIQTGSYSYSYSKDLCTITVFFKFK